MGWGGSLESRSSVMGSSTRSRGGLLEVHVDPDEGFDGRRTVPSSVGGIPTEPDKSQKLVQTPCTHLNVRLSSRPTRSKEFSP